MAEYLLFHYGPPEHLMPWTDGPAGALRFPYRCAAAALSAAEPRGAARALDLGCAVGGATFELAQQCPDVTGVDLSHRFIETAQRLAAAGSLRFPVTVEGDRTTTAIATPPPLPPGHQIRFQVGDALCLDPSLGHFDLVLAANLIDRVPDPRRLLAQLDGVVGPGGTLVLTSPYTWLPEYTPKDRWLVSSSRPTFEVLAGLLPAFSLLHRADLPFVIREHARKYQWSVAEATVWRRKR